MDVAEVLLRQIQLGEEIMFFVILKDTLKHTFSILLIPFIYFLIFLSLHC